jgi:hypothetical protein
MDADETVTTANDPWVEFSDTITFENVAGAVTTAFAEAVAADSTPAARVTTAFAEAVAADTTPGVRVSTAYVEAVVERDYAGWDVLIADDQSFGDA